MWLTVYAALKGSLENIVLIYSVLHGVIGKNRAEYFRS